MKDDLEVLRVELQVALVGLDRLQTQLVPLRSVDKWSIQQIVGHLLRTYASTERGMDARITKGTPTRTRATVFQRAAQIMLLRVGYFPHGRVAPEAVRPSPGAEAATGGTLIARIDTSLLAMNGKLVTCENLFGSRNRTVSHMVLGPLSVDQWSRFHLVHGRHHIKHIAAIRKDHNV